MSGEKWEVENERRVFERVSASVPLIIEQEKLPGEKIIAKSRNISTHNICIETDVELAIGDRIALQFQTINGLISVSAIVVRKADSGFGCQFVDIKSETVASISSWLFPPFEP